MASQILEINQNEILQHEDMVLTDDFSFSMGLLIASTSWIKTGLPYLYDTTHAIHVIAGKCSYEINLRHYEFNTGDLAIISEHSILEMTSHSDDYRIRAVSLREKSSAAPYCLLVKATEEGNHMATKYFELINDTLTRGFNDAIIDHLTEALRCEIMAMYKSQEAIFTTANNRNQDIFNRFLSLVSQYSSQQRNIAFYADQLFLSPRYLSTVIKGVSGKSLMHWVNLSVTNKAKIALRHTDRSIAEIAHELGFDEQTTFTRFFKRMTSLTPSEFRHQGL